MRDRLRGLNRVLLVSLFNNSSNCYFNCPRHLSTTRRSTMSDDDWKEVKEKYLKMGLEEKRKVYRCGEEKAVSLDKVQTWPEYFKSKEGLKVVEGIQDKRAVDPELNDKVSLWQGDITTLEIDGIVNAANESLLGGGGVDGAIHRAAGPDLFNECETLDGCPTGMAKITGGYKLPAKYVIHTVGPKGEYPDKLMSCYMNSMSLMLQTGLKSIAFPCISTGIYGYPNKPAADIALHTIRDILEKNKDKVDRVIFTTFLPVDVQVYEKLLQKYFPVD